MRRRRYRRPSPPQEQNEGFSFDYPAGWTGTIHATGRFRNHAVVIVASRPLDPCPNEACQRFATPPGTVVLDFRVGARLLEPDWTDAHETLVGNLRSSSIGVPRWSPIRTRVTSGLFA